MSARAETKHYDGVFEGGGVRGIGLAGALSVFEAAGYQPVGVAGTSAGAIVATLLAASYTAAEIKQIILNLNFTKFEDPPLVGRIPLLGSLIDLTFRYGLYTGDYFQNLMRELLAAKGVRTFADLIRLEAAQDPRYRYKARVVTSDISRGRMVVLPTDASAYGLDPDEVDVSLAVRMSMSIPFFFFPIRLKKSYMVDGGLLSNFPLELFDTGSPPLWPTLGFRFYQPGTPLNDLYPPNKITGPYAALKAMLYTASDARDIWYMAQDKLARTIPIDTLGVAVTDFQITRAQCEALFESGVAAAKKFLAGEGQGALVAQDDAPAPVTLRPMSAAPVALHPASMELPAAPGRTRAPAVTPTWMAESPNNPLVWNTVAIALVCLAIVAVLGLLIAIMTGALHLG
jgi:NTE family protein